MDSPILFDPDGDLRLEVGAKINPEEQLECIVCSKTLSRATSVFKNMLYGPFRESRASSSAALSTQNWVVELPEDNPQAMKILLGSMHSQYEHVPTALSLTELYQVLLVCDKYDTIRMIRPWAQLWFLPHTPLAKSTGNEILMWIAWELGSENVFREVAARLCLECEVDPEGHLLDSQGNLLQMYECPWPSSILVIESISNIRIRIISEVMNLLKDCIGQLRDPSTRGYNCQHRGAREDACDAMTLGSFVKSLSEQELQSILGDISSSTYLRSVNHLKLIVQGINVVRIVDQHASCNPVPAIVVQIQSLVDQMENPVTKEDISHLSRQREKTGLSSWSVF